MSVWLYCKYVHAQTSRSFDAWPVIFWRCKDSTVWQVCSLPHVVVQRVASTTSLLISFQTLPLIHLFLLLLVLLLLLFFLLLLPLLFLSLSFRSAPGLLSICKHYQSAWRDVMSASPRRQLRMFAQDCFFFLLLSIHVQTVRLPQPSSGQKQTSQLIFSIPDLSATCLIPFQLGSVLLLLRDTLRTAAWGESWGISRATFGVLLWRGEGTW